MTADRDTSSEPPVTDAGFTLTELVIVVFIMGLIVPVLAVAFSVVIRTTPSAEDRADDSRSLVNLTTWLSQDVASTSEDGFFVGTSSPTTGGCKTSSLPTSSVNLLELQWREGSKEFVTNYRWVSTGPTVGRIFRYACQKLQPASALSMTAELNKVSGGTFGEAPVEITKIATTLANGTAGTKGIQFVVLILDDYGVQRELLSLDATTTNVVTTLPGGAGSAPGNNSAPIASDLSMTITPPATQTDLLPITDPNGDPLVTTFPNGLPSALWKAVVTGVSIEVTPDTAAAPGVYVIPYRVTDPFGEMANAQLRVTVQASTVDLPPSANSVSVPASRSQPSVVSLVYSDPYGKTLTPVLSGVPGGWPTPVVSGNKVTVTPSATASGSYVIGYTVTNEKGLSATSQITVNVCTVSLVTVSPATKTVLVTSAGNLSAPVTVELASNGACAPLVLGFLPNKTSQVEATESFNASNIVTIGTTNTSAWFQPPGNSTRVVKLNVRQGANGPVELSLDLTTKGAP